MACCGCTKSRTYGLNAGGCTFLMLENCGVLFRGFRRYISERINYIGLCATKERLDTHIFNIIL